MMEAFIAGMVVAAVFLLGLWMILSAGRRASQNRARYHEARREARAAAKERDKLAEQLQKEEDRRDSATQTMVTPPTGTGAQTPGAPPTPRHAAPTGQQPVITNIKPGDSPTK